MPILAEKGEDAGHIPASARMDAANHVLASARPVQASVVVPKGLHPSIPQDILSSRRYACGIANHGSCVLRASSRIRLSSRIDRSKRIILSTGVDGLLLIASAPQRCPNPPDPHMSPFRHRFQKHARGCADPKTNLALVEWERDTI